jgi:hypothetical protein
MKIFNGAWIAAGLLSLTLAACGGGDEGGAEDFGAEEEVGAPNPQNDGGEQTTLPMAAPGVQGDSMTNPARPGPDAEAPLRSN